MHSGQFVFYQITNRFKRQFNRIVCKYNDRTKGWSFTHWNHLCVLIFAQLSGCASLRELVDIIQAHAKRSYNLGFGTLTPNRSVISKSNTLRDYRIYEEFAFYMVGQAQKRRITKEFELRGRFYAVDSTIIDLCLSVFRWAAFRTTKSGIRIHTQIDIATEIPVFYRITNANIHDVNSMDWIEYEKLACYVFDRGYFDLARLFAIEKAGAFFIIREKFRPDYEIEEGEDLLDGEDNVLRDQTVRFSSKRNKSNYPNALFIMLQNCTGRLRSIPKTSSLKQKRLLFCTNTDGRLSCSSSGSSSTSRSSPFGEKMRMLSAFRYMLQSSHFVSLALLNMIIKSVVQ